MNNRQFLRCSNRMTNGESERSWRGHKWVMTSTLGLFSISAHSQVKRPLGPGKSSCTCVSYTPSPTRNWTWTWRVKDERTMRERESTWEKERQAGVNIGPELPWMVLWSSNQIRLFFASVFMYLISCMIQCCTFSSVRGGPWKRQQICPHFWYTSKAKTQRVIITKTCMTLK